MLIQYCNRCGKRLPADEAAASNRPVPDPASLRCDECRAAEAAQGPKRVSQANLKPAAISDYMPERHLKSPFSSASPPSGSHGKQLPHGQGRGSSGVALAGMVAMVVSVLVVLAYLGIPSKEKPPTWNVKPLIQGAAIPTDTRNSIQVASARRQSTGTARTLPETVPSRRAEFGPSLPLAPEPARTTESNALLKATDAFAEANPGQDDRIADGYRKVTEQFPGTPAAYTAEMQIVRLNSRTAQSANNRWPSRAEEPAGTAAERCAELKPGLWKTVWDCSPDTKIAFHRFRSSGPQTTISYTDRDSVYAKHHGVLVVAKAGTYIFEIDCDGWGRLDLDRKEVVSSWSYHPGRKDLNLSAGAHEMLVIRCGHTIAVRWKLVGGFDLQAIPESALRYDSRNTEQYDRDNQ